MGDAPDIRNRITEVRKMRLGDVAHNPRNWRGHPSGQRQAFQGVVREIGWAGMPLVYHSERTGVLTYVDGHMRKEELPDLEADVAITDLDDAEADLLLAAYDPLAAMAEANREKLGALLQSVQSDEAGVQAMLAELAEREGVVFGGNGQPPEDPAAQVDRAEELREAWGVELGQIWTLGEHRLVCGDCTDPAVVKAVMRGERAQLGLTSPPYSVGKEYEKETSFDDHLALLRGFADRTLEVVEPGYFLFLNFGEIAAQSHTKPLTGSDRQCIYPISKDYWQIFHVERNMDLYAQRIWYKPFNRLQQPFWTYHTSIPHYQEWEHIWTWRLPSGSGDEVYNWDISSRAVWDTRKEAVDDKPLTRHVAAFPVCLPERAIRAHSKEGAIIWDPFSGSGTTIVVCEQLNRKCRAVEISPAYCAVILQRWHDMTGLDPQRID